MFFDSVGGNVCIGPRVKLHTIKADAPFADRELTHAWPYCLVELVPAHAQVGWRLRGPKDSRLNE